MIEALSPDRPDDPFTVTVLPWRSGGSDELIDVQRAQGLDDLSAVGAVPISDQVPGRLVERERLGELQGGPGCCRIGHDVEVNDVAPVEGQNQEDIQRFECGRRNGEEVDGDDLGHVVPDEGLPGLGGRSGPLDHVLGDHGLADVVTQLQQLAMNARGTPEGILQGHLADQRPDLSRDFRPPWSWPAAPAPVEPPACSVPPDDRIGLDDGQVSAPVGEKAGEKCPHGSIGRLQPWSLGVPLQNLELMPEGYVLQGELAAGS